MATRTTTKPAAKTAPPKTVGDYLAAAPKDKRAALMKLRKKSRKAETSIDEHSESEDISFRNAVTDSALNPEQGCLREERARMLREALAELRPNARRVLELYELEGRSMKEIAAGMGISVAAVKARIFHARPKMRRELGQYFIKRAERRKRLRLGSASIRKGCLRHGICSLRAV